MRIDKFDLTIKIISISMVISGSWMIIFLGTILRDTQIYFAFLYTLSFFSFSCVFFFFSFYSDLRNFYFDNRKKIGEWKTKQFNLDKKWIKSGGVVGYTPTKIRHIALIYPSDSHKNYPSLEKEGILSIIENYKQRKKDFILYFCYNCDDFKNIIKSDVVEKVHIFGHGKVDSLKFEDGVLQYRELKNVKPKELVAQWHCNHGYGISLGEYIGKKYYVPYGKRRVFQNKKDFKKLINDNIDWEVNPRFN